MSLYKELKDKGAVYSALKRDPQPVRVRLTHIADRPNAATARI